MTTSREQARRQAEKDTENFMAQAEQIAEDILNDRQQLLEFEKRSAKDSEALNGLKRYKDDDKVFMLMGDLFVRVPVKQTKEMIMKDQERLAREGTALRDGINEKAARLREVEGRQSAAIPPSLRVMNADQLD